MRAQISELTTLINQSSSSESDKALVVVKDSNDFDYYKKKNANVIMDSDVLRHRNNQDRVFLWERNTFNPDSSFLRHVRPYLGDGFPAEESPGINLLKMIELSMDAIFSRFNIENDEANDVLQQTLQSMCELSRQIYQSSGNRAFKMTEGWSFWSDGWMKYYSQCLSALERMWDADSKQFLDKSDAWKIVQAFGFPIFGNLNESPVEQMSQTNKRDLSRLWSNVVSTYVIGPTGMSPLLKALDKVCDAAGKINSWRQIEWPSEIQKKKILDEDQISVEIGQRFSVSEWLGFDEQTSQYWLGITLEDLRKALEGLSLEDRANLGPSDKCVEKIYKLSNDSSQRIYLIRTRESAAEAVVIEMMNDKKKYSFCVPGLVIKTSSTWSDVYVQESEPTDPESDSIWIKPSSINVDIFPKKNLSILDLKSKAEDGYVSSTFDLKHTFDSIEDQGTYSADNWECDRKITHYYRYSVWNGSEWSGNEEKKISVDVIVPSPVDYTTIFFSPTLKSPEVRPNAKDQYKEDFRSNRWESTVSQILSLESSDIQYGLCEFIIYDGRVGPTDGCWSFDTTTSIGLNDILFDLDKDTSLRQLASEVFEGSEIVANDELKNGSILTIEISGNMNFSSCGIVCALRNQIPNRKQPSDNERETVLGKYQDKLLRAINSDQFPDGSLLQTVIYSKTYYEDESWDEFSIDTAPVFVGGNAEELIILDYNGPSDWVTSSPEWKEFHAAFRNISERLYGDTKAGSINWLSSPDPSILSIKHIRSYIHAHISLIEFVRNRGDSSDTRSNLFWVSYPFSLFIANQQGHMDSVFLSPLHPARLCWGYSVSKIARSLYASESTDRKVKELEMLMESWNIPASGEVPTLNTNQPRPLVAVPIDHGLNHDFIGWSALSYLDSNGSIGKSNECIGLTLPWSSGTGINGKIVEDSIVDFMRSFPNLSALTVDLSSVTESPRSQDIDNTLMNVIGGNKISKSIDGDPIDLRERIPGGVRIFDSLRRVGSLPKRDILQDVQLNQTRHVFEWNTYDDSGGRPRADISYIENSESTSFLVDEESNATMGLIPIKRYSQGTVETGSNESNRPLTERFGISDTTQDPFGIHKLLASMENRNRAMRSQFNMQNLGLNHHARWEVIGSFHLDPYQLSDFILQSNISDRFLWEWKPAWLNSDTNFEGRPYYVIARVPKSLKRGFELNHSIEETAFNLMMRTLGYSGIGLSNLINKGGTTESAVLGFYYTLKMFQRLSLGQQSDGLNSENNGQMFQLVPIDPIGNYLETFAGVNFRRRADFIGVNICWDAEGSRIRLFPVETKYYGSSSSLRPSDSEIKSSHALQQLSETSEILDKIKKLFDNTENEPKLIGQYLKLHSLATFIDLTLSLQGNIDEIIKPIDPDIRERIISDILNKKIKVDTGKGVLAWFSPDRIESETFSKFEDEDSHSSVYVDPKCDQLSEFFWQTTADEPETDDFTEKLKQLIHPIANNCEVEIEISGTSLSEQIVELLSVDQENLETSISQLHDLNDDDGHSDKQLQDKSNSASDRLSTKLSEMGIKSVGINLSSTMLSKSTIDAVIPLRDLLKDEDIHDYSNQEQGEDSRVYKTSYLVEFNEKTESRTSLFRPLSGDGDPRIWFRGLNQYAEPGDHILLFVIEKQLWVMNASRPDLIESVTDSSTVLGALFEQIHGDAGQSNTIESDLDDDSALIGQLKASSIDFVEIETIPTKDSDILREAYDVTDAFRVLLKEYEIHEFIGQNAGSAGRVTLDCFIIKGINVEKSQISFYKTGSDDPDNKIWLHAINQHFTPEDTIVVAIIGHNLVLVESERRDLPSNIEINEDPVWNLMQGVDLLDIVTPVIEGVADEGLDISIPIGETLADGMDVEWTLTTESNPHLMIAGLPGMGKTTVLKNMCEDMLSNGISPIIFSYAPDIDDRLDQISDSVTKIGFQGLTFNPLKVLDREERYAYIDVIEYVKDTFAAIFPTLGDRQTHMIYSALKTSFKEYGWDDQGADLSKLEEPPFGRFYEILTDGARTDAGLLGRLEPLADRGFFNYIDSTVDLWSQDGPVLVQVHSARSDDLQKAFASFVFHGLYNDMFLRGEKEDITHAIIFDEAHKASKLHLIPKMAKECRKFGISLVLASQETKDFDDSLFNTIGNYLSLSLNETDARKLVANSMPNVSQREIIDKVKTLDKWQALYMSVGNDPLFVSLYPPKE